MNPIVFDRSSQPTVSVVMVTNDSRELIPLSLGALHANTDLPFEVVVVDNASRDGTSSFLQQGVEGATTILNERNVGFGAATNQGAACARGIYLCLLNPDAFVRSGWLRPLVGVLERDPRAGAVVPRILHPDGRLQEAGSVVFSDGGTLAVGDGDDPSELRNRFPRYIDYGSAACLLIRRSVFCAVGGFDMAYAPAYGEDVDLCFELAARGLLTAYEPSSDVVHVRGGTSTEAARLMTEHRTILLRRWGPKLANRPEPDVSVHPHRLYAARDAEAIPRILVIDDRIPHVDRGSGDPRMALLLSVLTEIWPTGRVTLLAVNGEDAERYAPDLLRRSIEIVGGPRDWSQWFRERLAHYCVIVLSRPHNFPLFKGLIDATQPQAMLVYDAEALFFRRVERMAAVAPSRSERARHLKDAGDLRALEAEAARASDAIVYVTDEERAFFEDVAPHVPTFQVSFVVDALNDAPGFAQRKDLVFFGSFFAGPDSPNEDAALYVVREVMPLIWRRDGDLTLHIVGADPTREVRRLHGARVNVVGQVADPAAWLKRARVHVGPLRYGSGIKLRFIDSMAAGLPFVTTPVGAEGLRLGDLQASLVADSASEVADKTWRLYTERARWEQANLGLAELLASDFSRAAFKAGIEAAMTAVGVPPPELTPSAIRSSLVGW